MELIKCILYDSGNYRWASGEVENKNPEKRTQSDPVGIVLHSTGENSIYLKRYVQPSKTDPNYIELMAVLGKNVNNNSWNRPGVSKCVHYMIGKTAAKQVAIAQLLPENFACWGIGTGSKGSYNYYPTQHIQIEMQDGNNADFATMYDKAIELCLDICKRYGWSEQVIVSHKEAYKLGYGSNHADCDQWFAKFNKTMSQFRQDVHDKLFPKPIIEYKVGDIVNFVGDKQWTNVNKADGSYKVATPGRAQIKAIHRDTKHPYLVRATSNSTSNVYGYVNADELAPIEEYIPQVHERVNFVGDKQWSNANKLNILGKKATPCVAVVQEIYKPESAKHPYRLSGIGVAGWVNLVDIEKRS